MKDGNVNRTEEPVEVSRHELYQHYARCYLQLCPEVRPCRDAWLLEKAAQYLLREPGPGPGGTFTVFPLYQAVKHRWRSQSPADSCKHLAAVIRAAELLETICVNLFLQPWRKEIRTLKTFTGPFVYCLLPVLSSSTIQSVLASIGYLPHTDSPPSEYRLSEDASPDRAMLLGFELMLARVECHHLLELLETDQLGPQELLEVLQRRVEPTNQEEPSEKKTTGQKEEEEKKKKKREEADRKEVPLYLDTRRAVKPQLKPRPRHLVGLDQSIMEMQMTYPDLAFRGRPLLRDKPQRANSSTDVHTSSTNNYSDGSKATELPSKAAATAICCKNDGSNADEVFGAGGGSSGCNDTGDSVSSSSSNTDGSRADELSGPQAVSLHITPGAGATAEHSLKPGESRPTAAPPAWTQQHAGADLQSNGSAKPKLPSLSSMDEAQELRRLAERMGQLHVQDTKEEVKRGEENTKKERRKKERKASTEEEAEEPKLKKKPSMQTSPALSHAASRGNTSSQWDPARTAACHRSTATVSPAERQTHERGDGSRLQDGDDTERAERGRGEEEQLDQSFVLVEHHEK